MEGERRTTAGRLAEPAHQTHQAQHPGGAGVARERIVALVDEGSFVETGALREGSTAVAGHGTIDGRLVCAYSQGGGRMSDADGATITTAVDYAVAVGAPVIGILDGRGPRLDQGTAPLARYGAILRRMTHASGVVPQLAMVMGPVTSSDAHLAALADFVIMAGSEAYVALNELSTLTTIGGGEVEPGDLDGRVQAAVSGLAQCVAEDEQDACDQVRRLLGFLPVNNLEEPPVANAGDEAGAVGAELDELIPDSPHRPYDIRVAVAAMLDDGDLCEMAEQFAPNIVCGFGRVDGHSVGVVANQPLHLAGCLDRDAARKAARFVRTCDAFNLPVLTVVDAPGFLPSMDEERHGLAGETAKLIFAYAEATVPLITVTTRAAYGGAQVAMASRQLGADVHLAWPTARIAAADAQAAISVVSALELAAHDDPETRRAELLTAYRDEVETPYIAAGQGDVDQVIAPHDTRPAVRSALRLLRNKRAALPPKKHGTMPL